MTKTLEKPAAWTWNHFPQPCDVLRPEAEEGDANGADNEFDQYCEDLTPATNP